jgi:hypothetical protein
MKDKASQFFDGYSRPYRSADGKGWNYDKIKEHSLQFVLLNFMGIIFAFQVLGGIWNAYMKERKMNQARAIKDKERQQTHQLFVQQQQQNLAALSGKPSGAEGAEAAAPAKGRRGKQQQQQQQQQMSGGANLLPFSGLTKEQKAAAAAATIAGIGVADTQGLDLSSGQLPGCIWVNEHGAQAYTDPLRRWQLADDVNLVEATERTLDPLY